MNIQKDLLPRDIFREETFKRDNYTCVAPSCHEKAVDAHHIIERRLWDDGGYYLDNGASVCGNHHIDAEMTLISPADLREYCGIQRVILPEHLYDDVEYDKWGNQYLENGLRSKGELFYDESVQKILSKGGVLGDFTDYVKYPRTYHAPWSYCVHSDDKVIKSTSGFEGKRVIVTEKMDGENTSLYNGYYHARSIDSRNHESRNYAKSIHAQFGHDIPEMWRLCCENMYMVHSIKYTNLRGYLYGLSIWNEVNECLDWDSTCEWFQIFELPQPKVLYDGVYDEKHIIGLYDNNKDWSKSEGLVIRLADSFHYSKFRDSVMKVVRKNHVQTIKHCLLAHNVEKNLLNV